MSNRSVLLFLPRTWHGSIRSCRPEWLPATGTIQSEWTVSAAERPTNQEFIPPGSFNPPEFAGIQSVETRAVRDNRRQGGKHVRNYWRLRKNWRRGGGETTFAWRKSARYWTRRNTTGPIHTEGRGSIRRRCDRRGRAQEGIFRREGSVRDEPTQYKCAGCSCVPGTSERRIGRRDQKQRGRARRCPEQDRG